MNIYIYVHISMYFSFVVFMLSVARQIAELLLLFLLQPIAVSARKEDKPLLGQARPRQPADTRIKPAATGS